MPGMARFGGHGKDEDERERDSGREGPLDSAATTLVERLLSSGFDGRAQFHPAAQVAREALADEGGDPEKAIADTVAAHRKLAATNGFVTGLGGLFTMPVALPANVLGFYLVSTRMVAAIAAERGYDIDRPEVRSAVLLTLIGTDADDVLKKAGLAGTGGLTGMATRKLPPAALMIVNKAVGFRLLSQVGTKALARLGKAVPFAGGVIGAGLDVLLLNRIAANAKEQFPPAAQQLNAG